MGITSLLKTTTSMESPLDASTGESKSPPVSDFLTIQSLTNFGVMTGSISAAWNALKVLSPHLFSAFWVPFAFAGLFGIVSILISIDGLKKDNSETLNAGSVVGAIFIAVINALVLASAVIGVSVATSPAP
jgi:hypothetical protein